MNLTMKVKSFTITSYSEKEAYIRGCKEFAKYMANPKYKNITFKIERAPSVENEFIFTMYTNLDLGEEQRNYCKMCKEFHTSFFINESYNCNECRLQAFLQKAKQKAQISKGFYREKFDK